MPKGLSRSTQGHANRAEPPKQPTTKAADEAEVLPQLKEAGVVLGSDGSYQLITDSFKFREHLKRTMKRDDARDELIQSLSDSWEDASSLRQALSPMGAATAAGDGVKDSLVRMLLQVDPLQTELANTLFEKLGELQADMESDGNSMPLPRLIISQFRWLEHVVDGEALINTVSQTLQVIDAPLQKELVLVLPDLVTDDQHAAAVDMLSELLRKDNQFTAPVLDSLGSLQLNPVMLKQVNDTVTESVASANPQDLPMVIRFLLQHMTEETAKDVVGSLRGGLGLDMLEPDGDTAARPGQPGGETLVLDAVQSALRLRKDLTNLVLKQLDAVARGGYRAIDWWLICALHSTSMAKAKPKVTKLVTSKAAKQQLTPQLLRAALVGHGAALRPYYATHLELAGQLLRATDATARQLGRSLYVLLLHEFRESYDRQELIGCLLTHVGSGNEPEVDTALLALVELSTEHTAALSQFSAFLTAILDHLDALTLLQARLVFDLFARLACDAPDASRLPDELAIIIRKQLTNANVKYKRLGVLGGCCVLSRIGARRDGSGAECAETERAESSRAEAGGARPMEAPRIEQAREMLELMLKNTTAADGSRGFLLRELSRMVAAREMRAVSAEVVDMLAERVTTYFESDYMADVETLPLGRSLVHGLREQLTLGLDPEPSIAVNLLPLLRTSECPAAQRHKLNSLSSTFELLRVCEAAVASGDDGLEAVDAVLGCPIVLFDQAHLKDFNALPDAARSTACLALFYAVDWLRELLNAFATQADPELRTKVVERLHQLRWLELELDSCLAHTPHFRLPGDTGALFKSKAAKAPAAKKQKAAAAKRSKAGSEVDSSENETDAEAATAAEALKGEDGKGKGKATEGGAASKARGKPSAPGAHFARLAAQLRPLSLETSRILTYAGTPSEGQTGEAAEFLRPAAVHYLLSQLHSTLKATLAAPSRFAGRPSASGGGAHDTSGASELRALSGAALLRRIEPAVYSFREHAQTLLELLPQVHLPSSHQEYRPNLADKDSFSAEPEDLHRPHVEPALRLLLKCLLLLVEAPQLRDVESEPRLLRMLAHLGSLELPEHHNGALSKASGAEACAAAFDFFLTLRPELPSLGAAHELMVLERAILRLQSHVCGGAEHVPEASLRQDGLATLADSILTSPPVERGESKAGPSQLVVADLFKCHVAYSDRPLELLATWTEELLPELEGAPDAAVDEAPLLKRGTVPAFLKVLFPLLIQEMGKLPLPKPERKPQGKAARRRADPEEAAQLIRGLHKLVTAFEALVKSTKHFETEAVLTVALKASAEFLTLFNARALPYISANFLSVYTEALALIKHVQPSTRLLQTHCMSVKQRMATGAAAAIPKLKRQLEELIFTVKVILKENDCAEGFWMGNLKHKNSKGEEVSSQMQVERKPKPPKKAPKPRKRKKAEAEAEEEGGEEGGEEGEEGGAQADDEADDEAAPTDDEDAVEETLQEMEDEDEGEGEGEDQDAYPDSMLGDEEEEDE